MSQEPQKVHVVTTGSRRAMKGEVMENFEMVKKIQEALNPIIPGSWFIMYDGPHKALIAANSGKEAKIPPSMTLKVVFETMNELVQMLSKEFTK